MEKPNFLVRPKDFHIFELDESNSCYRSYSTRDITHLDETRPNASPGFTLENLTSNHGFIPIKESELKTYEQKHELHLKYISWATRPDGHGGSKGGTMEEYLERFVEHKS